MYGTVARLKVKEGGLEQIRQMEMNRQPEGFIGTLVFQSDFNPKELWLVAVFKDKAAYFANADSPEQDQEFRQLSEFFTADPDWNDGEVVFVAGSIQG